MFRLLANKIVGTIYNNCATTNITTASWVTLIVSMPIACTAIEIFNPSDAKLQLSIGAAGHETETGNLLPYTIQPGGSSGLLPVNLPNGKRLSVKAIDQTVSNDYFIINFFG